MKHVWQSSKEHTSGSFNVTEDVASLTSAAYQNAVSTLPGGYRAKKLVSVSRGPNLGNLEKDFPKLSGIGGFRRSATPRQALPLYMDKTSLYHDLSPELSDSLYYLWVAIHGKAVRVQTTLNKGFKEFLQLKRRILGNTILTSYNCASLGIHQRNDTTWTVQECPVQYEMPALRNIVRSLRSRSFQTIIDHLVKLPPSMPALACQLSD